ncbi:MAG: acetyl-CoA acetyltransferase [Chloroflexi bacterium]|nr:acetyl-CoA acetyltransferase [Chloroflexota bacterium]MBM3172486.1 acetyl-CoA acetyltransferase [Chloroflexota bacterium]MBM3175109.1 acetyl-CoA acetyltransferase [Chloroflexota bacterium]MBM4450194.1 acetyl-CoA acetyltransferase [Chloroflexota bacterium]
MADGIKDKVAIVGMGCTKFGERWECSAEDLMTESFKETLADAGIEKNDIQAAWLGTHFEDINVGKGATPLSSTLKLPFIPCTRVDNFCATGTEALRAACYAVAAGACDIALALGVEKLKDTGYGGLPAGGLNPSRLRFINCSFTTPGTFAMVATRYFATYGLTPEEGKMMLAKISAKSHHNGALNPKAHLRRPVTIEQIINAPIVAWPLGLFDCCGVSDGSAAAIVVRADMAKKFRQDPVFVKALQIATSPGEELIHNTWDGTHIESGYRAGIKAYAEASIKNPREEISMAEVHDCFSINEAITMEDLQFSPRGKVKEDIDAGRFNLDGPQPIQPDGGLKSFGHPIGASGLRMMYEMYKQLQGKAGERQIPNPKYGLTHNMGGVPAQSVVSIAIVGRELG